MTIPTLTTTCLTLRPFTERDVEPLHRILTQDAILRHFPRPDPLDLARVERLVAGQHRHWEEHGLGKWLIECVVTDPDLRGIKQILLATRDAHELYRRYGGFEGLPAPEKWLIRRQVQGTRPATPGGSDATRKDDPSR